MDVHLLMSHIYLAQGNFAMCSHCLELGVSHNFQVGSSVPSCPLSTPQPTQLQPPTCPGRVAPGTPYSLQTLLLAKGGAGSVGFWNFLQAVYCESQQQQHAGALSPLCFSRSETTPSTTTSRPGPSTSLGTIQKP